MNNYYAFILKNVLLYRHFMRYIYIYICIQHCWLSFVELKKSEILILIVKNTVLFILILDFNKYITSTTYLWGTKNNQSVLLKVFRIYTNLVMIIV